MSGRCRGGVGVVSGWCRSSVGGGVGGGVGSGVGGGDGNGVGRCVGVGRRAWAVGRAWGVRGACVGRAWGEPGACWAISVGIARAALLSGYLGKSGHLPRYLHGY